MDISHLLPERFRPPRFFFGWYIAMAGGFNNFFVIGITITGLGVFYEPLRQETGWSMTSILAGASLRSFEQGMMAPATGFLVDRLGSRRMAITGLTILSIGLVMLSQAYTLWFYYLASLVVALGQSLGVFTPFATALMFWFQKNRASAMGMVNSGNAFGYFMPPVLALGVLTIGWRTTMALAGVCIFCVGVPIAYFILRDRPEPYGYLPDGEDPEVARAVAVRSAAEGRTPAPEEALGLTVWEAVKTPAFFLLILAQVAGGATQNLWNALQYPHLQNAGYTIAQASIILSVYGTIQGFLRIAAGRVADKIGRRRTLIAGFLLQGVGYVVFAYMSPATWWLIPVLFLTYGLGHAGWNVTSSTVSADYFGTRRLATLRGLTTTLVTPVGIIAPILAGLAFDNLGNYMLVYTVCGVVVSTGAVWIFLIQRPQWSEIRERMLAEHAAREDVTSVPRRGLRTERVAGSQPKTDPQS